MCQHIPDAGSTRGAIQFTVEKLPRIIGVDLMLTTVMNGQLEAIYADTLSHNSAEGIIAELTAKFGPPSAREPETAVVDKIGVPSIRVVWRRPGYIVEYHSIARNEIDYGRLSIETDKARLLREKREAERDAQRTAL